MAKLIKRQRSFGWNKEHVATTLTGLEASLAEELEQLGAGEVSVEDRAVSFRADRETLFRILLSTRLAMRILRRLATYPAEGKEQLYKGASELPWEEVITPADRFAIRPQTNSQIFKNAKYASQVLKDAIVDRQRKRAGKRSSIDAETPDLQLQLRIVGSQVEIFLDASADPLSRRGYRRRGGVAPMNEVLAAGILELAGWDGTKPLFDPFCGSGTILAEAAIKGLGLPPHLERKSWAHFRWPDFDRGSWERARSDLRATSRPEAGLSLHGSDISDEQLQGAQENLRRLGVADRITLDHTDFQKAAVPEGPPMVITNLPYGYRLGGGGEDLDESQIGDLYRAFGDWLKQNLSGGEAWVLTGNLEQSKSFGLRSSARIPVYNGPIECRLLHFELY